jgi:methyl-accepting chemotaxis protein
MVESNSLSPKRKSGLVVKIVAPVFVLLAVCTIVLTHEISQRSERLAVESTTAAAMDTIEQFRILRAYYTEFVANKVVKGGKMTLSPDHKTNPKAIPLPATLIQDLSAKLAERSNGTRLDLYSKFPFPSRASRQIDVFQRDSLDYLAQHPKETFSRYEADGAEPRVRIAVADVMTQACVDCHNSHPDSPKRDWKVGDVRGVLSVTIPIARQMAANDASAASIRNWCIAGRAVEHPHCSVHQRLCAQGRHRPDPCRDRQAARVRSGDFHHGS